MISLLVAVAVSLGVPSAAPQATFIVTIPSTKDVAHVEANYVATQDYIAIAEGSYSQGVEGGLAGFVQGLTVSRPDGTPVAVEGPDGGRWRIDAAPGDAVTVRYNVRLEHGNQPWAFGADEVAYNREDCVFFVSRTLLVRPVGVDNSRVRIVVPDGWKVETPWALIEGRDFTYDVANEDELLWSCVIVGDFLMREVRVGDTKITLTMGHELGPHADTFDKGLRASVSAFARLFNDSPHGRFLVVMNVNPMGGVTNGSALSNSLSIVTPARVERTNFDQAMYTLAHEVLHLWNGHQMRPAGQIEWFVEGFTDYLTWRTLMNEHLLAEKSWLTHLRRELSAYLNFDRSISIAGAGSNKSTSKALVYDGGSLTAMCLDVLIRRHSDGKQTISDFMRELYAQTALRNVPYDKDLIASVAAEFAGQDIRPFIDRHVYGTDPLPLDELLPEMGIRLERTDSGGRISVVLTVDETATGSFARNRDEFLGRR